MSLVSGRFGPSFFLWGGGGDWGVPDETSCTPQTGGKNHAGIGEWVELEVLKDMQVSCGPKRQRRCSFSKFFSGGGGAF